MGINRGNNPKVETRAPGPPSGESRTCAAIRIKPRTTGSSRRYIARRKRVRDVFAMFASPEANKLRPRFVGHFLGSMTLRAAAVVSRSAQ